jgi:hypothetical protein
MATLQGDVLGALITILGYDGTNFRAVRIDTDGHLQIDGLSLALPTGAATEATLGSVKDRIGDISSPAEGSVNYQLKQIYDIIRLNNISLYASQYGEQITASGDSGDITAYGTAVPAGKLLVVTNFFATLSAGSAVRLQLNYMLGVVNYVLRRLVSPTTNAPLDWQGQLVLKEGDKVRAVANTVTTGTTLSGHISGYFVNAA